MAVYIAVWILLYIFLPKQLAGNACFTQFALGILKMSDQLLQPLDVMFYTIDVMFYTIIAVGSFSKGFIVPYFLLR